MKTKDIIELVAAVLIFVVAGYFIYTMLAPKPSSSAPAATIVEVTPIDPNFDQGALQSIGDPSQTRDFYTPPNLQSGLGNTQPFGQ